MQNEEAMRPDSHSGDSERSELESLLFSLRDLCQVTSLSLSLLIYRVETCVCLQ